MLLHRSFISKLLAAAGLLFATRGWLFSQTPSARDVLVRFCDLDTQGEQLSPEGWEKAAALFATPSAPRRDKITVVRDFVVSNPAFDNGKAQFYVEYVELGRIDTSTARLSTLPPVKVRVMFELVKPSGARSSKGSSHVEEPAGWRITGSVPVPRLTIVAAIRYATKLREDAKDADVRKNAGETIAALNRFR